VATPIDSRRGRFALMAGHCAGMIDLVALPVWVGTLIGRYGFDPQRAGALATLFLLAVVAASVLIAPRLPRLPARPLATAGFGVAALGFFLAGTALDFLTLAALHGLAGAGVGTALSVTHGTIARSARPHRLFALANLALGVFGVVFLGATPKIVDAAGGPAMFVVFGAIMAAAALVAMFMFPADLPRTPAAAAPAGVGGPMPAAVWFGIAGISCMTIVQAMTFSFLERVGMERGFGAGAVQAALIAVGLVGLLPSVLAALLEHRLPPRAVLLVAPPLQALVATAVMTAGAYPLYAAAAALFAPVLIFSHTFAFGLLARLDPSGRALAATPAMCMAGSAVGPLLGGTLVNWFGYASLGAAAMVLAGFAVICFSRLPRGGSRPASVAPA
jgi:predicted MFS family arabinose efflux permease